MSAQGSIQFQVQGNHDSPFLPVKKPSSTAQDASQTDSTSTKKAESGSHWGLKHLNWLHVELTVGCAWQTLFSPKSKLSNGSKCVLLIENELGMDWSSICGNDRKSASFYARLKSLAAVDLDHYTISQSSKSPTSTSSSKDKSTRDSLSPRSDRHIAEDGQGM